MSSPAAASSPEGGVQEVPTALAVPDHIAYCFADGRPIFLDVTRDRYFTLSQSLGEAFGEWIRDGGAARPGREIEVLVGHGVLGPAVAASAPRRPAVPVALENDHCALATFRPGPALAVVSSVLRARRRLRRLPFAAMIEDLRRRAASAARGDPDRTRALCERFVRHRSVVPVASVCLLDSIALLDFLAARDAHADLVFGVTASPFLAHCWLQDQDRVLNDRLDRVMAFTPILVV